MSERSFPFDDSGGDRELDTAQWARLTAALASNGVVPGFADEMAVVPTSPESLAVDVDLGRFHIEGRYYEVFSEPVEVALATADPTNPRIDRIVVRRSIANREVTVEALTGTPGVSPSAPALTQSSAGDWEESLAQVAVAANETTIAAGDITDERSFARSALYASARGWEDVVRGEVITGPTNFPIESGKYDLIKMYLRGQLSSTLNLGLNINDDSTVDLHRGAYIVWDTDGGVVDTNSAPNALTWAIGQWGQNVNNISELTLYNTDVSSLIAVAGTAYRAAATQAARHRTEFNGDLAANRLLSLLRVTTTTGGGAGIDSIRVWIEGHLA